MQQKVGYRKLKKKTQTQKPTKTQTSSRVLLSPVDPWSMIPEKFRTGQTPTVSPQRSIASQVNMFAPTAAPLGHSQVSDLSEMNNSFLSVIPKTKDANRLLFQFESEVHFLIIPLAVLWFALQSSLSVYKLGFFFFF